MTWQLQEAKNKLSEVVDKAQSEGPQTISRRGKNTSVLMSYDEYQKLAKPKTSLKKTLMSTDFHELELELERDRTTPARGTQFRL